MAKRPTQQVFLSHTQKERELADALAAVLSEHGIAVWHEQRIEPGKDRSREVRKALEECDSMIALLTPHSFSSSYVRDELQHALFDDRYKHRLLSVMIGGKKEDFVRLPWILDYLEVLHLKSGEPTRRQAKRIAESFLKLLSKAEASR